MFVEQKEASITMADVKWIKIATDIFDDEKILLIESLPEKYAIITCWFKLLCLAGKQNNSGVFLMNDKIAYTDEMLSTIFRMHVNTVRLSLQTFQNFGMIELIEGVITIPNWDKHQQLDALENKREYMKKYMAEKRANQKQIACKTNSKTNSKTNVSSLDKDIDIEEDIDNICITNINITNTSELVSLTPNENALISLILNNKKYFNIFQKDIDYYQDLYPAVNVLQELKLMKGWLDSNPSNRKTEKGIKAFITRWLGKKQDKAPRVQDNSTRNGFEGFEMLGDNERDEFEGFRTL